MGIQLLMQYAESLGDEVARPVRFLGLARNPERPVRFVIDGESCLEALAGGPLSDDVCGGQWVRTLQNVLNLTEVIQTHFQPVHIVVAFDGLVGLERFEEWAKNQLDARAKVELALKHIDKRGTPPPKVWTPLPASVRFCVIQALHQLKIPVFVSVEDFCRDIAGLWRHHPAPSDALITSNGEFFAWAPPRMFCGNYLRIERKVGCVTKEYMIPELCKKLGITVAQFPLLCALLGTHRLTETDLAAFHAKLVAEKASDDESKKSGNGFETLVPAVAEFVSQLKGPVEAVGALLFPLDPKTAEMDPRAVEFVNLVQYFKGEAVGKSTRRKTKVVQNEAKKTNGVAEEEAQAKSQKTNGHGEKGPVKSKQRTAIESILSQNVISFGREALLPKPPVDCGPAKIPQVHHDVLSKAAELHGVGLMSPFIMAAITKGEVRIPVMMELATHSDIPNIGLLFRDLRRRVYAILFNYHHYQYNMKHEKEKQKTDGDSNGEGKENNNKNVDGGKEQSVKFATEVPEMKVREWVWSAVNPYKEPELVEPLSLGWQVPTVRRLWFGEATQDGDIRMQAFLTCMRSQALKNVVPGPRAVVGLPNHSFVLVCVLRYILTSTPLPIMSLPEIRAALATAFSPLLGNYGYLREIQAQELTRRGVQIASAINFGIEMAAFANNACGAPFLHSEIAPWVLFDGKLFQNKLIKAFNPNTSLVDLCDGSMQAARVLDVTLSELTANLTWGMSPNVDVQYRANNGAGLLGPHIANVQQHDLCSGQGQKNKQKQQIPPFPGTITAMHMTALGGLRKQQGPLLPFPVSPCTGVMNGGMMGRGFGYGGGVLYNPDNRKQNVSNRGGRLEIAGIPVGRWDANSRNRAGHNYLASGGTEMPRKADNSRYSWRTSRSSNGRGSGRNEGKPAKVAVNGAGKKLETTELNGPAEVKEDATIVENGPKQILPPGMLRSPEAVRSVLSAAKEEKDDDAMKRVEFDESHDSSASEVTESHEVVKVNAAEVSGAEIENDHEADPNETALTNGDDQEAVASE